MEPSSDPQRAETEKLMALVYDELRAAARMYFRKQPPGFTMRPTEIVNEACLSLMQHARVDWQSPEHFRAIATRKIYQVVVDHLRARNAGKRGGAWRRPRPGVKAEGDTDAGAPSAPPPQNWKRVPLDVVSVEWRDKQVDFLDLADALEELRAESGRLADVVTLHWFGGLKYSETAKVLGVSASTVEKDFHYALAWLHRRLAGDDADAD